MSKNEKIEKSIMRETIFLKYEEYLNKEITDCNCGENCKQLQIEKSIKLARKLSTEQILECGCTIMFYAPLQFSGQLEDVEPWEK